jgi:hypothetical protein
MVSKQHIHVSNFPCAEKVIALTLDDGPHAHITPQASSFLLFDFMPNLKKVEVGKTKNKKVWILYVSYIFGDQLNMKL